jgi:tetratricopeptide (TPR) repeat protein
VKSNYNLLKSPILFTGSLVLLLLGTVSVDGICANREEVKSLYERGNSLFEEGRYREAADYYEKAIILEKNFSPLYYNLATAQSELGEYEKSIKNYQEYLRLSPKGKGAKQAIAAIKNLESKLKEEASRIGTNSMASQESVATFSPWMTLTQFQDHFDRQLKQGVYGFYPKQLEGREQNGKNEYRGMFVKIPSSSFHFWSHIGLSESEYDRKNNEYKSKGFVSVWHQEFTTSSRQRLHQGTWVRQ